MKFGGEFGGYGDTSFRPACAPFSPSVALLSSFNANVAGEERTILKREEEEAKKE